MEIHFVGLWQCSSSSPLHKGAVHDHAAGFLASPTPFLLGRIVFWCLPSSWEPQQTFWLNESNVRALQISLCATTSTTRSSGNLHD